MNNFFSYKSFVFIITFMVNFIPELSVAMMRGRTQDPLAQTNYRHAFNQQTVYESNRPLMDRLGVSGNVFSEEEDAPAPAPVAAIDIRHEYIPLVDYDDFEGSDEWKVFCDACLKRVRSARRWAITQQARESASTLVLVLTGTGLTAGLLGVDSTGGGFVIFGGLFNSVFFIREILGDLYTLYDTPSHPLDDLEVQFATNRCFIPKQLWPKIAHNFATARQNPFNQQDNMNFIQFALGLRIFYPLPDIRLVAGGDQALLRTVSLQIDRFFDNYNDFDNPLHQHTLKVTVLKFLLALLGAENPSRYLYLHGPGGIGKTYFTDQLCRSINTAIQDASPLGSTYANRDAVHIENVIVTTSEELEGSSTKPGALLKVLRNQCQGKKKGSIVFMDEATWLNDGPMVSPAKRVFNGTLTRIATDYLGSDIDGAGLGFETSPMLIILAGNDEIEDPALKSRFEAINFPSPKAERLTAYGDELFADACERFHQAHFPIPPEDQAALGECTNFREVESLIPALATKYIFSMDAEEGVEGSGGPMRFTGREGSIQ